MKHRNIIAVLIAGAIVAAFFALMVSRPDERRGAVTIWYAETDAAAAQLAEAAGEYNSSLSRTALPVKLVAYADERALAAAFDEGAPDIVLCSHFRAFDMAARGRLTDISASLASRAPSYPKGTESRNASIGKSFFPIGISTQVLLVNKSLCTDAPYADLEALCARASAYADECSAPFFAVSAPAELFFTALLRAGEEFVAQADAVQGENYIRIYNLIAGAAYCGALADMSGAEVAEAVATGALPCAIVSTASLSEGGIDGCAVYALPTLSAGVAGGSYGEAFGLAVTAGGSRSMNDIAAFIAWLFSSNRDVRLALQASCVPAREGTLITRNALWSALLKLDYGGIFALLPQDSDFAHNKAAFDEAFSRRMRFIAQ